MKFLLQRRELIAVDKPAGVTVIPGREGATGISLREQLQAELGRTVWVVHRIDRDTSGIVLFALDAQTHRHLSMAFEAGRVKKRYAAMVRGVIAQPLDLQQPLIAGRKGKMRVPFPEEDGGKETRTLIRPIEALREATLVDAEPLTGRTHQIRVQLAAAGHPLLVDHQYGSKEPVAGLTRTPLHAKSVELQLVDGESVRIESPLPEDMVAAIAALRS